MITSFVRQRKAHMSKKTFTVDEILWAVIEHAGDARCAIAVSMAGEPWAYVRIKGPGDKHQVLIERYNATGCFAEIHSTLIGVEKRPSANIENDPLGHSAGPSMGPFLWAISAANLGRHYGSPFDFVEPVLQACAQAASPW
jgi:hypothetical protein